MDMSPLHFPCFGTSPRTPSEGEHVAILLPDVLLSLSTGRTMCALVPGDQTLVSRPWSSGSGRPVPGRRARSGGLPAGRRAGTSWSRGRARQRRHRQEVAVSPHAVHASVLDRTVGAGQHVSVPHFRWHPAPGADGHVHGEPPFRTWDVWGEERPEHARIPPGTRLTTRPPSRIPERLASSANLASVIRFEKVTKTYPGGTHPALDNVSIDIEKGEFVFLVGTSGSGKSTALRLVLRETRCTKGRVYVAGKEINRLAGWKVPRLRRQIGTVFQDFRLLPNKTVGENVAFALQVIGKSRSDIRHDVPETLE